MERRHECKSMARPTQLLIGGGVVLLAFGVAGLYRVSQPLPADGSEPSGADSVFPGTIEPAPGRLATLAPQTMQPIRDVFARVGQRVKKGQVVIQPDDDEAQAAVKAKEAELIGA